MPLTIWPNFTSQPKKSREILSGRLGLVAEQNLSHPRCAFRQLDDMLACEHEGMLHRLRRIRHSVEQDFQPEQLMIGAMGLEPSTRCETVSMNVFGAVLDGLAHRQRIPHDDADGAERLIAVLQGPEPQSEIRTRQLGGGIL